MSYNRAKYSSVWLTPPVPPFNSAVVYYCPLSLTQTFLPLSVDWPLYLFLGFLLRTENREVLCPTQQPGVHWEPNPRCWGVWLCFNTARSHCVYIVAVFSTLPTALIYSVSCHTSIFPRQSPQYSPGLTKRERERQTGISCTFAYTACQSSSQTTQREPQCF